MITQYNRQQNKIYPLNQKGYRQAERNNSHQLWSLLSWEEEVQVVSRTSNKQCQETFDNSINETSKIPVVQDQTKKSVSFKVTKNEEPNQNQENSGDNDNDKKVRVNSFLRSGPQKIEQTQKQPIIESQYDRLKRKSIEKYINDQKPFSRTMSNSAFRKFYQRPCPEAYGRKNTHTERGAFYGNFMKTHNIQPHTLDNKPETYQTFTSALNFGKRTKLDLEDRWKRIERQLAKNLDYRELAYMKAVGEVQMDEKSKDEILKANIAHYGHKQGQKYKVAETPILTKSAKSLGKLDTRATFNNTTLLNDDQMKTMSDDRRTKSSEKPLYYIYKCKQTTDDGYNYTRYARDRHGITCYVDNAFRQNDEAFVQFQKKIKPIMPEKCKPEDMNIDSIRIKNCEKAKQEEVPRHYLMPVVDVPYVASKYSRKKSVVEVNS